jgi:FkbM family methyltransferase
MRIAHSVQRHTRLLRVSRVIPFNVLTPTRYGTMLTSQNDVYVGGSLLRYGEFSELEIEFLRPYLQPGAVVLDIGANIGALTLPFATLVGPKGAVIAFEPQRLCFQTLCANVALNSLTNVVTFQRALGSEMGVLRVPLTDPYQRNNYGGLALSADANGEHVEVWTIDEMGLPAASLCKIDVEGMECEVLKGARGYIAEHRPVLYLEADRHDRTPELMKLLDELEYTAYRHNPLLYNANNWRGDKENIFGQIASLNLLALPSGQQPPEGLEAAT